MLELYGRIIGGEIFTVLLELQISTLKSFTNNNSRELQREMLEESQDNKFCVEHFKFHFILDAAEFRQDTNKVTRSELKAHTIFTHNHNVAYHWGMSRMLMLEMIVLKLN